MPQPQYQRAGTLWYAGDGFIWDDLPATCRTLPGRPLECSSQLLVYNPDTATAHVTARFYHTDRPPTSTGIDVAPGAITTLELATLSVVPHKQPFWIVVESDVPVLPQARHEDYMFWDPVPDAMVAPTPYPGPLTDETVWIFPDCYQGGPQSWYERELLSILNPGHEPVTVRIRYFLRTRESGAEEQIEIPAERVAGLDIWERGPRLLGSANGPPVRVQHDYAVRIDASAPVIAQTTRRARWTLRPSVVGARSLIGFPLRSPGPTMWHYPGGMIVDRGVLPREANFDVTWNLLFTHNLDEMHPAQATILFHHPGQAPTQSPPLTIPPLRSDLQWLHLPPWLGEHTAIDRPFGMTVSADQPVVPEVTCAEFEMWSQMCPGAMSAVNFYPGPLRDERRWWLGIAPAGGADDRNVAWLQSYHLLNPGDAPVHGSLTMLGAGMHLEHPFTLAAGSVTAIHSTDISGLPLHAPFAVRADGDRPFCAQVFVRTFTRGLAPTRGMYACMGVPMQLD